MNSAFSIAMFDCWRVYVLHLITYLYIPISHDSLIVSSQKKCSQLGGINLKNMHKDHHPQTFLRINTIVESTKQLIEKYSNIM